MLQKISPTSLLRQPPLSPVTPLFFRRPRAVGEAIALGVVGDVNVVIEIPHQPGILMLDGFLGVVAAIRSALVEQFFLVRHAIARRVAVGKNIQRVRFANRDPIIERQNRARQIQVIDKDRDRLVKYPSPSLSSSRFTRPFLSDFVPVPFSSCM